MNSGDDIKRHFDNREWLDKWRELESIWVDMSWFNRSDLTIKKYIHCVGTFCGVGQVDWWYAKQLDELSDEEKDELESLCIRNRDIIQNGYKHTKTKMSVYDEAIEHVKMCYVDDSKGLPAMLLGDVGKLIEITTGKPVDWNTFKK